MSEIGRRNSGDDDGLARQDRRNQNPEKGKKEFVERRGTGNRSDKHRRGGRTRDGRSGKPDRDFRERRDGRPRQDKDERRRSDRLRDDRRGNERRRDDRGRKPTQSRPRHERGGRPARKEDTSSARDLPTVPELPESAEFTDLDAEARRELRTLPKNLAERVGRHLVAAGMLIDEDPEAALSHARYAKSKASRIPIVREALGLTAYHAGEWAEALSELRAVRRMTRTDLHIAVIADAERALGRPERALDFAKEVDTSRLPKDVEIELKIVVAGARRDMGQLDAAVVELQGPDLDPNQRRPWSHRLFYAYADNLAATGRMDEAVRWFLHAAEADEEGETDAAERAGELTR
ncbi:hypothetical protein [Saccharomonospora sp.]|uniref:tetratricopeptide repeat protein n=1 Tax=Saccharomonospora sp. TaxID=33913 RepID=UPI00262AE8E7|nr:hypothetical protein [Saccharomonospora sp.]